MNSEIASKKSDIASGQNASSCKRKTLIQLKGKIEEQELFNPNLKLQQYFSPTNNSNISNQTQNPSSHTRSNTNFDSPSLLSRIDKSPLSNTKLTSRRGRANRQRSRATNNDRQSWRKAKINDLDESIFSRNLPLDSSIEPSDNNYNYFNNTTNYNNINTLSSPNQYLFNENSGKHEEVNLKNQSKTLITKDNYQKDKSNRNLFSRNIDIQNNSENEKTVLKKVGDKIPLDLSKKLFDPKKDPIPLAKDNTLTKTKITIKKNGSPPDQKTVSKKKLQKDSILNESNEKKINNSNHKNSNISINKKTNQEKNRSQSKPFKKSENDDLDKSIFQRNLISPAQNNTNARNHENENSPDSVDSSQNSSIITNESQNKGPVFIINPEELYDTYKILCDLETNLKELDKAECDATLMKVNDKKSCIDEDSLWNLVSNHTKLLDYFVSVLFDIYRARNEPIILEFSKKATLEKRLWKNAILPALNIFSRNGEETMEENLTFFNKTFEATAFLFEVSPDKKDAIIWAECMADLCKYRASLNTLCTSYNFDGCLTFLLPNGKDKDWQESAHYWYIYSALLNPSCGRIYTSIASTSVENLRLLRLCYFLKGTMVASPFTLNDNELIEFFDAILNEDRTNYHFRSNRKGFFKKSLRNPTLPEEFPFVLFNCTIYARADLSGIDDIIFDCLNFLNSKIEWSCVESTCFALCNIFSLFEYGSKKGYFYTLVLSSGTDIYAKQPDIYFLKSLHFSVSVLRAVLKGYMKHRSTNYLCYIYVWMLFLNYISVIPPIVELLFSIGFPWGLISSVGNSIIDHILNEKSGGMHHHHSRTDSFNKWLVEDLAAKYIPECVNNDYKDPLPEDFMLNGITWLKNVSWSPNYFSNTAMPDFKVGDFQNLESSFNSTRRLRIVWLLMRLSSLQDSSKYENQNIKDDLSFMVTNETPLFKFSINKIALTAIKQENNKDHLRDHKALYINDFFKNSAFLSWFHSSKPKSSDKSLIVKDDQSHFSFKNTRRLETALPSSSPDSKPSSSPECASRKNSVSKDAQRDILLSLLNNENRNNIEGGNIHISEMNKNIVNFDSSKTEGTSSIQKEQTIHSYKKLIPGYTTLFFDTNILMRNLKLFNFVASASLFNICIPDSVIIELIGLKKSKLSISVEADKAIKSLKSLLKQSDLNIRQNKRKSSNSSTVQFKPNISILCKDGGKSTDIKDALKYNQQHRFSFDLIFDSESVSSQEVGDGQIIKTVKKFIKTYESEKLNKNFNNLNSNGFNLLDDNDNNEDNDKKKERRLMEDQNTNAINCDSKSNTNDSTKSDINTIYGSMESNSNRFSLSSFSDKSNTLKNSLKDLSLNTLKSFPVSSSNFATDNLSSYEDKYKDSDIAVLITDDRNLRLLASSQGISNMSCDDFSNDFNRIIENVR